MLETNKDMAISVSNAELAKLFSFQRALIYKDIGKEKEAEQLLKKAAVESVGMGRVNALGWLGILLARRGMKEQARGLQKEIEAETRMPRASMFTPALPDQLELAKQAFGLQIEGEILLSEKNADAAIQKFKKVIEIVPLRNALFPTMLSPQVALAASQSLAKACEQRGEWGAAASAYETILKHKELCMGSDGASTIWVGALGSIITALEKAGRSDEAGRHREMYHRLRPM